MLHGDIRAADSSPSAAYTHCTPPTPCLHDRRATVPWHVWAATVTSTPGVSAPSAGPTHRCRPATMVNTTPPQARAQQPPRRGSTAASRGAAWDLHSAGHPPDTPTTLSVSTKAHVGGRMASWRALTRVPGAGGGGGGAHPSALLQRRTLRLGGRHHRSAYALT